MFALGPRGLPLNVPTEPAFEVPEEISRAKRLARRLPGPWLRAKDTPELEAGSRSWPSGVNPRLTN